MAGIARHLRARVEVLSHPRRDSACRIHADLACAARGEASPPQAPHMDMATSLVTSATVCNTFLQLFWTYPFDLSKITIDNLNDLIADVTNVQLDLANNDIQVGVSININAVPFLEQTGIFLPSDILSQYQNRVAIVRVPMLSLLFLVLFFVSMMTSVLLDRQTEAIAILRSRGTSRGQILGAFAVQSLGLGLLALLLGPLLALAAVSLLASALLPANQQNALALIAGNPLQALQSVIGLALGSVAAAILAMIVSALGALRLNILSLRQETARSTQRPFWQPMRLDSIALIVLVIGSLAPSLCRCPGCAHTLAAAHTIDGPGSYLPVDRQHSALPAPLSTTPCHQRH